MKKHATVERHFANGSAYCLHTADGWPIEVTDTFLPFYTKFSAKTGMNALRSNELGGRNERWMIGVSIMSGCPVGCKFCATGALKRCRALSAREIVEQVDFVLSQHPGKSFASAREHKINFTRMGEPFLNLQAVREAIAEMDERFQNVHHYVSTIGLENSDFSWIKGNITLQISLHSLSECRRKQLIPRHDLLSLEELGQIRTSSNLKTTLNLTLLDNSDFDIGKLSRYFSPDHFFVKLSPLNRNAISDGNKLGFGLVETVNIR